MADSGIQGFGLSDVLSELTSSRASPLPQWAVVFTNLVFTTKPCGSWLASDGAQAVTTKLRLEPFPAPTRETPPATARFCAP